MGYTVKVYWFSRNYETGCGAMKHEIESIHASTLGKAVQSYVRACAFYSNVRVNIELIENATGEIIEPRH